jgi:phosphatidylglycerol:prolipoprotein diacylglycerol transferase
MYPQFDLPYGITLYTFGLALSVSFLLFFWMLHKLSKKYGINTNFFIGNALPMFLSAFVFSRLFNLLSGWQDIASEGFVRFFFTSGYDFSLAGGMFGFFLVLFFRLSRHKLAPEKYLDAVVLAFFFSAVAAYIGAFFGGQIYGKPTYLPFGVTYTDPETVNPYTSPVVPLALVYAAFSFLFFVLLYIARATFVKIEGLTAYVGMAAFAAVLLVGEFWNGADDSIKPILFLNLNQIMAVVLVAYSVR